MAATKTMTAAGCGCCDDDCCLVDILSETGLGYCLTFVPGVNTLDPTAGAAFRYRNYYRTIFTDGYFSWGKTSWLALSGKATIHGKETCYSVDLPVNVDCVPGESGQVRLRLYEPGVIRVFANDTQRALAGWIQPCPDSGATTPYDEAVWDMTCTEEDWLTGQTVSISFDYYDPRDAATYTVSLSFTVYIAPATTGPACPAFSGAIDPPVDTYREWSCSVFDRSSPMVVHLNDGNVSEDAALNGWLQDGTDCYMYGGGDPPDYWISDNPDDPTQIYPSCIDGPLGRTIQATLGGGTGDCDCADGTELTFTWYYDGSGPGNGFYTTHLTPVEVCGHSFFFVMTCFDGDWFLGVFVDGVGTGTIAWDLEPGNDPDNPEHFELHIDFGGDLCTGRIFLVAG